MLQHTRGDECVRRNFYRFGVTLILQDLVGKDRLEKFLVGEHRIRALAGARDKFALLRRELKLIHHRL